MRTDVPTPRDLERRAYQFLLEVENFSANGPTDQVNALLKSAEIKVQIAQAYISLARNLRASAPGAR